MLFGLSSGQRVVQGLWFIRVDAFECFIESVVLFFNGFFLWDFNVFSELVLEITVLLFRFVVGAHDDSLDRFRFTGLREWVGNWFEV